MTRRLPAMIAASWMILAAAAQGTSSNPAPPPVPRVTYTLSFEASSPAFVQIAISRGGAATVAIRETASSGLNHLAFTASAATVTEVFKDAAALHDFAGKALQSHDKVAYTGERTVAYDDAGAHHAQQFTYTRLAPAADLDRLMQRMATTASFAEQLQQTMRYDRLDTLGVMEQIGDAWQNRELAEPRIIAPLLRRLMADPAAMEAARRRAGTILAAMQRPARH